MSFNNYEDEQNEFYELIEKENAWLTERMMDIYPRVVEGLRNQGMYNDKHYKWDMKTLNRLFLSGMAQVRYSHEEAVRLAQRLASINGMKYY